MGHSASAKRHTVSAFDEELEAIGSALDDMARRCDAALDRAVSACFGKIGGDCSKVIVEDRQIDQLNETVDRLVIQSIALRAPMADDLRYLLMATRVASILERVGDQAKSIAKQGQLERHREFDVARSLLSEMGELASSMINDAIESFRRLDPLAAQLVRAIDRDMNARHAELTSIVMREMQTDTSLVPAGINMMFASKQLERVGDYAANIANAACFASTGTELSGWSAGPRC